MIGRLAWRNVWRNKVRSLVVVFAIAIGLLGVIFVSAMSRGMVLRIKETTIENQTSDLQVHSADYSVSEELKDLFQRSEIQTALDENDNLIRSYAFRVMTEAMAASANNSHQVMLIGVDPDAEREVTAIHSSIKEGQYFGTDTKLKEIVVGEGLAEELKLKLGSKVVLSFADVEGAIMYESFKIVGLYKTNSSEFDKLHAYANAEQLVPILKTGEGNYHELAVRTGEEELDSLVMRLESSLEGFDVKPWYELNPGLKTMESLMDFSTFIMVLIVLIALIFGIINTMLMVVMERRKELGMLRALGMNNRKIASMIILETIFLGLLGGILGNAMSFIAIKWFGYTGITFESAREGLEMIGVGDTVYPELKAYAYVAITALVLGTALLASIFPVRRALRQDIAETIRN